MSTLKDCLNRVPIWAFNINDLIEVKAIVQVAEKHNVPIIMLISSNAIDYSGLEYLSEIIKVAKKVTSAPLFIQLDHGKNRELILKCARVGFDAIMVDASFMGYERNIRYVKSLTGEIKKLNKNILIEAELGVIDNSKSKSQITILEQVKPFISRTKIDLLAVSVGNNHGFIRPKPDIDRELLKEIHKQTDIPLVLHGGDWIKKEDIKFAVQNGIRKINIGPELRVGAGEVFKDYVNSKDYDINDHRKLINQVVHNLNRVVSNKLLLLKT